jgi:hypothetical protein
MARAQMTIREPPPSSPQQALTRAIARLPKGARAKYNKLVAEAEDATTLVRATVERRKLLEDRYMTVASRRLDPRYEPERVQAHQDELAQARAALDAVEEQLGARNAVQGRADQIVAQLKQFLATTRGPIRAASITARPRHGEDAKAAVLRIRAELAEAHNNLATAKAAPPTRQEIEKQLSDHIQQLMNQGVPRWTLDADGKVIINWPDTTQFSSTGTYSAPSGGASKLLCYLFPDQCFAALSRGLEDWPQGVSAAERDLRVAQLEQHIRNLEYQEESLIEQAQAQGIDAHRIWRSGWAVLGVEPDVREELQQAAE